jgi:hypothetical protein
LLVGRALTVKRIRELNAKDQSSYANLACQPVGGGGRNSPFRRANVKGALINERENKLL